MVRILALITLTVFLAIPARGQKPGAAAKTKPLALEHDLVLLQPASSSPPAAFVPAGDQPWQVIYLNFDGEKLKGSPGNSNSKTNETSLVAAASFDYPAFQSWDKLGNDRQKSVQEVIDILRLIYMKFAVKFVTTRPADGDYTMVMIGGDGQGTAGSGAAIGVAPLDGPPKYPKCGNTNKNDIVFVFGDKIAKSYGAQLARALALVAAHELGHSFGLEHVTDDKGIMFPQANVNPILQWVNAPVKQPGVCGNTNQDAEALLRERLGEGKQDTVVPLVWFKRPGSGAVLPPEFSFEVAAADDLGVHHVEIFLDEKKVLSLTDPPFTNALTKISDGEHTLRAEVQDWANQRGTAKVTFTVDSKCALEGSCYGGKGGLDTECQGGADCESGICALDSSPGSSGRCVEKCSGETAVCPKDTKCREVGGSLACLPEVGDWSLDGSGGGDGCAMSRGPGGAALPPLALLLALALLVIRRR
jgi:hypothetical protein